MRKKADRYNENNTQKKLRENEQKAIRQMQYCHWNCGWENIALGKVIWFASIKKTRWFLVSMSES